MFEKIKKLGVKVMDKVTPKKEEGISKLTDWKSKLKAAETEYQSQYEKFSERELIYLGTHEVDPNVNSTNTSKKLKKANNVRNITYEFIESQVDATIPKPSIRSKRPQYNTQALMAEDSIKNDLQELDITRINDRNERTTPIHGLSLIEVIWDTSKKHHLYIGDIGLRELHPKQIIPQPGVWEIQKMDYFFLKSSVSKLYIKKRYGVDVANEIEDSPEVNSLGGETVNSKEMVTETVCWYRDEDGDTGRYTWVNNIEVEDLPKFFYRRLERCTKCDTVKVNEECECGNKTYKTSIEEFETLTEDITLANGTVLPKGTEIPYFSPTKYPIIVRENVPLNFAFGGQSDIDVIRDQQDAIKKVVSKAEEKLVKAGAVIGMAPELKPQMVSDSIYRTVYATAAQLQSIVVKQLQANIQDDLLFVDSQYKAAQSTLGITDSFQGKPDNTAQSGLAKQIQVAQASGRMQSKLANKYAAYKEMFEIMFEFKLALCDEKRPFVKKDQDGNEAYGDFDRYAFLEVDASGEYYYVTDFIFSADAGNGLPNDKIFLFNEAKEQAKSGLIDALQYWTILEGLHYPNASEIKKQIEAKQKEQEAMLKQQSMQQTMQQTPPQQNPLGEMMNNLSEEEQRVFKDNPEMVMANVEGE